MLSRLLLVLLLACSILITAANDHKQMQTMHKPWRKHPLPVPNNPDQAPMQETEPVVSPTPGLPPVLPAQPLPKDASSPVQPAPVPHVAASPVASSAHTVLQAATPLHRAAVSAAVSSPFFHTEEEACSSCCDGGSCTYSVQTSSGDASSTTPMTVLKALQCCGKLDNKPTCCAASQPGKAFGAQEVCSVDENGYTCKKVPSFHLLTESSYLSPGGLVVIIVVCALVACCYCALASRRAHAKYNGQPSYYNGGGYGPGYGGSSMGGGMGGGGLCAACLAGFCCTELCCTGNLNF